MGLGRRSHAETIWPSLTAGWTVLTLLLLLLAMTEATVVPLGSFDGPGAAAAAGVARPWAAAFVRAAGLDHALLARLSGGSGR
jgi:hypothetical protein